MTTGGGGEGGGAARSPQSHQGPDEGQLTPRKPSTLLLLFFSTLDPRGRVE